MRRPPSVNLGPPNISETTRARKLKLKMQLDMPKYSLGYKIFPLGATRGRSAPNVNLGLTYYLVKYSLSVQKFPR